LIIGLLFLAFACRETPVDPAEPGPFIPDLPVWDRDTTFGAHRIVSLDAGVDGMVALIDEDGIVSISTNEGLTWASGSTVFISPTSVLVLPGGGILVASRTTGLYRSADLGSTWSPATDGISDSSVTVLFRTEQNLVFAGTWLGNVYYSTNGGDFWHQRFFFNAVVTAFATTTPDTILTGTWGNGIYLSPVDSQNAEPANAGLLNTYILSLAAGPGISVYAGMYMGGACRSSDGGRFWQTTSDTLRNTDVNTLAADSAGRLFAGTPGGVLFSSDSGIHWLAADSGSGRPYINTLRISSSGFLFAATDSGLFRARKRYPPL
jgi:ligand-binding sensor domain-containing protein